MDINDTKTAPAGAAASAGVSGPGPALRQARTDLRLSPEDVANQLHLAPRQIVALEADDYELLPQTTYVRGYLRSYALFLGLAPEPILDAYNRAVAQRAPTTRRSGGRHKPGAEYEGQSKFGAFAVGGLVLVLVIAWWQGRESDDASRGLAPTPTETPPAVSGSVPADPTTGTSPPSTPDAASAPTVNSSPGTPPPATGNDRSPGVASPPPAATPAIPAPPAPTAATAPATQAAETPAAPPKPQPLPRNARQARLVLNATAESWVEVRDARGERLLYQTLPPGRIVGLEGMAPFRIFLGNADGVAVAIDGESYDVSRHRRGTTARFNLSPPAAAATAGPETAPPSAPAAPDRAGDAPAPSESPAPPLLPE